MPSWLTILNYYERLDLVAYLRALAPDPGRWLPGGAENVRVQSVIPEADVAALAAKLAPDAPFEAARDHTVDFVRVLDADQGVVGHVSFTPIDLGAARTLLCVAVGADGRIAAAGTHHRLKVKTPPAGDAALDPFFAQFKGADEAAFAGGKSWAPVADAGDACRRLAALVQKAYLRLRAGIDQDKKDVEWAANPPPPAGDGEKLYRQACGSCHGDRGNAKGKNIKTIEPRPRNLMDGAYMNQPQITRDYILSVAKKGGKHHNIADTMPQFEKALTEDDFNKIVDYILSLPVPKRK